MNDSVVFDFLLPIGAACQTRYQVERFLRKEYEIEQPSCFFDWLGLGGVAGVRKIVELDFNLFSEDFSVRSIYRSDHFTPIHELTGFRFQHDFSSNKDNQKTEVLALKNMLKHIPTTLAKYKYLGDRTQKILEKHSAIGLVYHGKTNEKDVADLLDVLEHKYGSKFYFINIMNKGSENPINLSRVISLEVDNQEVKGLSNEWQGSDNSWNLALSQLNLSGIKPFDKQSYIEDFSSRNRSVSRWKCDNKFYSSLKDFKLSTTFTKGIHTLMLSGLPLDIHMDIKEGCPLVFFLNGAVDRKPELKLPVFSGFGVIPTSGVSRVCINDPSLYKSEDLALGWYAGTEELPLQSILIEVFKKITSIAKTSKVVFVGGSGGGFASLYYSKYIPKSLAVVWNPQTDILEYRENAVKNYAKKAFSLKIEDWNKLDKIICTDLSRVYSKLALNNNYILYLQNDSDWHVQKHCLPFLEKCSDKIIGDIQTGYISNNLYLVLNDWGNGHIPPPKDSLSVFFEKLFEYQGSWEELFNSNSISEITAALKDIS